MTHQETGNEDESIDGNQPVEPDGSAESEYPKPADRSQGLLSRRGTLGLLSLGGLGLLTGQVSAQQGQRGRVWKTDIDADENTLFNLGALAMAANQKEITDFEGENLSIDGSILTAQNSHTNISDDGSQLIADTADINFGSNLDVADDGDGSVTVSARGGGGHRYETNIMDSESATWEAITGLSRETLVEVTIDTYTLIDGRIGLETDGTLEAEVGPNRSLHRVVAPTTSVTVTSAGEFAFLNSGDARVETEQPGIALKSDGTKLYICGGGLSGMIHSFNLADPWEITSASIGPLDETLEIFDRVEFPTSITFKDDGTRLFVTGLNSIVAAYVLSTPWDITTATFGSSFDVSSQAAAPRGIAFKPDGTMMYVSDGHFSNIHSYSLSNPWDPSTASIDETLAVFEQDSEPRGIAFNTEGTKLYLIGENADKTHRYILATPWDLATAFFTDSLDISGQAGEPEGLALKPDESKMFVMVSGRPHSYERQLFGGSAHMAVKSP